MKSTGIVRKVDELGRIVLPIELRRTLDIAERDSLEIFVSDETIVLKKYQPSSSSVTVPRTSSYTRARTSALPVPHPWAEKNRFPDLLPLFEGIIFHTFKKKIKPGASRLRVFRLY